MRTAEEWRGEDLIRLAAEKNCMAMEEPEQQSNGEELLSYEKPRMCADGNSTGFALLRSGTVTRRKGTAWNCMGNAKHSNVTEELGFVEEQHCLALYRKALEQN